MPLCIIRIYRSTVNAKLDDFSPLHQHHLSQQFYNLNENKISKLTHFVCYTECVKIAGKDEKYENGGF